MDAYFRVVTIAATPNPQRCIYAAMHQDYNEGFVADEEWPEEAKAGKICVKRLLAGERGHYGPLEHPQITFNVGWFPHSVMQQARTHRIGTSFDVQSFRYTGDRICKVADRELPIEEVFYLRPAGDYAGRNGKEYQYSVSKRLQDLCHCIAAANNYCISIGQGMPEEQARGLLPFDTRQHFVVSFNMRSLMHFLDLRTKLDAQLEIRQLCDLMLPHFIQWAPQIAHWYMNRRWQRAMLAP